MSKNFPLVLSMTQFAHYHRCKKLFQFDAIMNLNPRRDSEAASNGRDIHSMLAHAAEGEPNWADQFEGLEMLPVAQAYLAAHPLPERKSILAVERGFYAEVAPDVFIRTTYDLAYQRNVPVVRDYKSFRKAPSFDVDLDFQGDASLVTAEIAFGVQEAEFEWVYIRQELGRFLSGGKGKDAVWTPWSDDERYPPIQTKTLSPEERAQVKRELYDCALDIQATIENGRYYRTGLKAGPHSCESCYWHDICKTDREHNGLSDADLEYLTAPDDYLDRIAVPTLAEDPRVLWYQSEQGMTQAGAIGAVYGTAGEAKFNTYEGNL